jgi:hypothetical protein
VTGLPVTRIARQIDPLVRRSTELGLLNGHVPITAVITATVLVAAVLDQRDAVVLSNEWSASVPTVMDGDHPVNHQWSKSSEFEQGFAELVTGALGPQVHVFSYLRPRTELWVAQQFARHPAFHGVFRSCNRAFHQNPAQRLDHWCGECDKCCFIDLILAPFLSAEALGEIFAVKGEPLRHPELRGKFRGLLGAGAKPFECVGEVNECRAAVLLAARRADRGDDTLLRDLAAEVAAWPDAPTEADAEAMLAPVGENFIPDAYFNEQGR